MSIPLTASRARRHQPHTALVGVPMALGALAVPSVEVEAAATYAKAEKAAATRRAYRTDFAIFQEWCGQRGANALPAEPATVAAFLSWEADRRTRPSTIGRRVAAIRYAHTLAGCEVPTDDERVRATVRGIRRAFGTASTKKTPATADRIMAMAPVANTRLGYLRDRALLLLGFAGAFRRSELVALDIDDIEESEEGLRVMIRRGKTDQEGKGAVIAIVRGAVVCPVAAYKAWIKAANISTGPVFRPIAKGERLQEARLTDHKRGQDRQGSCRAYWTRPGRFLRAFAEIGVPDQRRRARRVDLQDDGREPAQKRGHLTWVRAGRRVVPGSRRGRRLL